MDQPRPQGFLLFHYFKIYEATKKALISASIYRNLIGPFCSHNFVNYASQKFVITN